MVHNTLLLVLYYVTICAKLRYHLCYYFLASRINTGFYDLSIYHISIGFAIFIFDLIRTLFLLSHAKGLSCFTKIGNLMAKIFDPKEKNGCTSRSPHFQQLFKLYCCGRFGCIVKQHAVDMFYFVYYSVGCGGNCCRGQHGNFRRHKSVVVTARRAMA